MTDDVLLDQEAEANGQAEPESAEPTLEEQLAQAQAQAEEYRDSWLRARAEFANARKRMERERQETYGLAVDEIVSRLLPVLDDLQRAMESVPPAVSADSWSAGIELVQRKLVGVLESLEIEPIDAVGQPFDPNLHEAIMQDDNEEFESGTISRELQTGYRRGEKIIRPALVAVAR